MSEKQNDDVRIMRALDVLAGRDGDRMRRANAFVAAIFGRSRNRCTPDRLRGTHEVLDQVRKAAK